LHNWLSSTLFIICYHSNFPGLCSCLCWCSVDLIMHAVLLNRCACVKNLCFVQLLTNSCLFVSFSPLGLFTNQLTWFCAIFICFTKGVSAESWSQLTHLKQWKTMELRSLLNIQGTYASSILLQCFKCVSWFLNSPLIAWSHHDLLATVDFMWKYCLMFTPLNQILV